MPSSPPIQPRRLRPKYCSQLAEQHPTSIQRSAQNLFSNAVGRLINEEIDRLLEKQKLYSGPIPIPNIDVKVLATEYCGLVRKVAAKLSAELALAVGGRKGLGKNQKNWIEQQVREFVRMKTSLDAAGKLFHEIFGVFTIVDPDKTKNDLCRSIAHLREIGDLVGQAREEIAHAEALFGGLKRSRKERKPLHEVSAAEKVRDPDVAARDAFIWYLKNDPVLRKERHRNKQIAARLTTAFYTPPEGWGVKDFNRAYGNRKVRRLLHKMISAAKPH